MDVAKKLTLDGSGLKGVDKGLLATQRKPCRCGWAYRLQNLKTYAWNKGFFSFNCAWEVVWTRSTNTLLFFFYVIVKKLVNSWGVDGIKSYIRIIDKELEVCIQRVFYVCFNAWEGMHQEQEEGHIFLLEDMDMIKHLISMP